MKKEWTEQDLRAFAENAQTAFEDVTLTEADEEAADTWQDDGLQVDYVLRNGQVDCVLRRLIEADGKLWQLQMTAPLAGSDLPEDRMTARERELCRDDMNHDFLTGVFNRRYFETEFCTRLDEWTDAHRCASLALVALDDEDGMRTRQGDAVMNQLVCFVANQWKKYYDRPAERVVCRLTDTLFAIGCADKNCAELAEELNGIYAEMPRACVASVGLMRRVPFTQSIGCACTGEVRGKNWDALYQLCEQRLKAAQKNDNLNLLEAVVQNTEMGKNTLEQIVPMTEDPAFRAELLRERNLYRELNQEAHTAIEACGGTAQGQSIMAKLNTKMGIGMKTLTDRSTRNLAEMLSEGSSQGVMDCIKSQKDYPDAAPGSKRLMQKLQDLEEENRLKLEQFL